MSVEAKAVKLPKPSSKKRKAAADTEAIQEGDQQVVASENVPQDGGVAAVKPGKSKAAPAVDDEHAEEEEEEIEVVSHAEQRKRRKLEKKRAKDPNYKPEEEAAAPAPVAGGSEATSTSAERQEKDDVPAAAGERPAPRGRFGVWVGNLSFKTDAEKLRTFFTPCGTITRVHMPKGPKMAPNKGFAYVDFESADDVQEAIKLSESGLDGRRLLIKDSKSYEGRPVAKATEAVIKSMQENGGDPSSTNVADGRDTTGKPAAAAAVIKGNPGASTEHNKSLSRTARKILDRQKNLPAPTLFLGNLGFDTSVEGIREFFETHYQSNRNWLSRKERGEPKAKSATKKSKKEKKVAAPANKGKGKETADEDETAEDSDEDSDEIDSESGASSDEDKGSESDADDSESESEEEEPPAPKKTDAGIRKVRLGTFEDTGKCKGWAFVDFHTTVQATAALIDPRNHSLNGRTLVVEYASAEAVRRGGGRMDGLRSDNKHEKKAQDDSGRGYVKRGPRDFTAGNDRKRKYEDQAEASADATEQGSEPSTNQAFYRPPLALNPFKETGAAASASAVPGKPHKPNKAEREALRAAKGGKRQKPGAALANAARAKIAIQPAAGTKTTFE